MRNILVTGGAGYIGGHTCKALKAKGFFPVALDNLVYGHKEAVKWGPLIIGDINDTQVLEEVFVEYQPEAVIHFAAYAYVGESVGDPGKYYQNNVAGTVNLLESMRKHNCSTIIFSSTCATYGVPERIPLDEKAAQQPINPYGWSKLMIEQVLRDYDFAYGLKSVALRYFNAAGADPGCEIGEDHDPETHLIPLTIEAALGRRESIEVYGTDYDTPDGTAVRDYIHVSDLADAHILALEHLQNNRSSMALNLGTGTGTSVKEIIDAVNKVSENPVPVVYGERRVGDPAMLVASLSKAEKVLGWKPKKSSVDTIVRDAWRWHYSQSKDF